MSQKLIETLTKCLIDTAIFLEFSDENILDVDASIQALEQMSSDVQSLDGKDKVILVNEIEKLASHYPDTVKNFLNQLPENLGITR